jgi:hypothetical protein
MTIKTLSHIHYLLKVDASSKEAAFQNARSRWIDAEERNAPAQTVSDRLDEMDIAREICRAAQNALDDFESTNFS